MTPKCACRSAALALLGRRDYATTDLAKRLKYKGYPDDSIEEVINEFAQNGYLDDVRYGAYLIKKQQQKGLGIRHALLALKKYGISPEPLKDLLTHQPDWQQALFRAWTKRFKGQKPKARLEYAKQIRVLKSRGFTEDEIKQLFENDETCLP